MNDASATPNRQPCNMQMMSNSHSISKTRFTNFAEFSAHIACDVDLVVGTIWRRCDTLWIFGFVDDGMFAHNDQAQATQKRAYIN